MWRTAFVSCVVLYTMIGCIDIASGTDEYVHPHYTYSCAENKSIIIRGINEGGLVWIKNANLKVGCTSPVSVTNQQALIKENCTTKDATSKTVTITIWDKQYDALYTTTPKTTTYLKGGRSTHEFKLVCHEINSSGVFRVAERQMNSVDTEVKTDGRFEVGDVEMTFRKKNYLSSERLTHVYTGDEFFMFLNYKGTQENSYAIMPKECFAVKGYNVDFSTIQVKDASQTFSLWTYDKCITQDAKTQAVMENFTFSDTQSVASAKMYGFHFTNDPYISIVCNVTVCTTNKDQGCTVKACATSKTNQGRRKKRDVHINLDQLHLSYYQNKMQRIETVFKKRSVRTNQADIAVFGTLHVSDVEDTSGVCIIHLAPIKVLLVFLTIKLVF